MILLGFAPTFSPGIPFCPTAPGNPGSPLKKKKKKKDTTKLNTQNQHVIQIVRGYNQPSNNTQEVHSIS